MKLMVSAMLSMLLNPLAVGDITVEWRRGGSTGGWTPAVLGTDYTIDSANNIEILTADLSNDLPRVYRVYADTPGNEDIGVITFDQTFRITLIVGEFETLYATIDPPNVVPNIGFEGSRDWGGLTGTGAHLVTLQALITRDLTGPVTAGNIRRIDAGRNIIGDISKDSSALPSNEPINAIRTMGGFISGDVVATQSNSRLVRAQFSATA